MKRYRWLVWSGAALVAVLVVLGRLAYKRWDTFGNALASGEAATLLRTYLGLLWSALTTSLGNLLGGSK